ncbi:MAG: OPT family oligopeptide transporter [Deltaproteobacteria bacterium]
MAMPADQIAVMPEPAPVDPERHWLEHVYQGDVPQLTFRAVGMGLLLGAFMSFSNIYVVLKTGWLLGVAITACILAFSIFRTGFRLGLFKSEPSILEVNCLQSTASGAGYTTGATLGSAFSAYLMITGHQVPMAYTLPLVFFLAMLGVFMAVPMKRAMINVEQLPFPSGTAAAETLRSLYAEGGDSALRAKALFWSMGMGAAIGWFRDGMQGLTEKLTKAKSGFASLSSALSLPNFVPMPKALQQSALGRRVGPLFDHAGYGFSLEMSSLLIAAGALAGFRTGWSMLLGAVVNAGVLAPWMHHWAFTGSDGRLHHVIESLGYRSIVSWSVWPGVAMMSTAALLNFAFQGKTIVRAVSGLGAIFGGAPRANDAHEALLARIEVPNSWFLAGFGVAAVGCVVLTWKAFGVSMFLGAIAVLISFVLAIVACRATGETDTTPIGALGKITQLTYGVLAPQNMTANLMTANVTASVSASSADLLTDLKSGYLLGANPRQQFLAQFFGVFAGALVVVPVFYYLVPNASVLGGDKFPAPSAQVWKAVAELLAKGVHSLHATAFWALAFGGLAGIALTLLEKAFPKQKAFIPSPTGVGLAFVIPTWNALSFFIGGALAYWMERRDKAVAERTVIPVASGLIAGESIVGVAVALLAAAGVL